MKSMKKLFKTAAVGLPLALAMVLAHAQDAWPSRPIKIVVPLAAGGSLDVAARIIGEELSKELKQPVIVDNRTGASGMIGANAVAKSPADGYTLFITISSIVQNDVLHKNAPYRLSELLPLAEVMYNPIAFSVQASHPAKSLSEFVSLARKAGGSYSYGSYGTGTSGHILGEQLARESSIKWSHVPYKGEMPAMNDLIGGHITAAFGTVGTHIKMQDAQKTRLLVISGNKSKLAPQVPTFADAGFPGLNTGGWTGFFVPAKTPRPIVDRLSTLIVKIVQRPAVAARLLQTGLEPTGKPQDEFAKVVAKDREIWAKLINDNDIQAD